ncbi:type II toxin-antitoxin system PemK/MazF family toxin [Candidatus Poribacteria bacterium]|nr:MAG: type II toxin-antitoxin system PemK/MazF family toxin [Candidatus Poribacteria bacterium]
MMSPSVQFNIGEILWVDLPQRIPPGHEQLGRRPVIVVGIPQLVQPVPYRMFLVVPLTRTRFQGPLFPLIPADIGGLPADSTALIYQVGAIDARRVVGSLGNLSSAEMAPIWTGLRLMFGFREDVEYDNDQDNDTIEVS